MNALNIDLIFQEAPLLNPFFGSEESNFQLNTQIQLPKPQEQTPIFAGMVPGSEQEGSLFRDANLLLPFEKELFPSRNCDSLSFTLSEDKACCKDTHCDENSSRDA